MSLVLAVPGVALAHDPVFVGEGTPPDASPLIEDGTISFATYGTITTPGGESVLRLRLAEGQSLLAELLVPDRPPENESPDVSHLGLSISTPDGNVTRLSGDRVLERFDEPFSKTSYLRVLRYQAMAVAGITTITVSSAVPTRFTLATGAIEKFGTAVSSYERRGLGELARWYATPPPAAAPSPTQVGTTSLPAPSAVPAAAAEQAAGGRPAAVPPGPEGAGSSPSRAPWWVVAAAAAVLLVLAVIGIGAVRRRRVSPT